MAEKIGFIGLGIMGKPMARNLLKAGYELTVYDIVGDAVEEVVGDGATGASSCAEVAAATDKIITMLPDSADSERAILGAGGVLEGAKTGSLVIDMSSIAPSVSQRIAAECAEKGVDMLDAPVSGGEPGAVAGTLAIMVGGKQEQFDQSVDLLKVMGANVVRTGDIGAGGVTKLANQIIVAANIEALAEALVLAQKAGVDPENVLNAIRGGLAGSAVLEAKGPMMLKPQLQGRLPRPSPSERPSERAANSPGTEYTAAGHFLAATDAWGFDERGRGGIRPFGDPEIRREPVESGGQGRRLARQGPPVRPAPVSPILESGRPAN